MSVSFFEFVLSKMNRRKDFILGTSNTYDLAGRLRSATDQTNLTTAYDYAQGGLVSTVTRPGNATQITLRYLDGNTKSVTGTGVIAAYNEYGVSPDGSQWSKNYIITESESAYVNIGGDWWRESIQKVYASENNGTPTTTGTQRNRVTGLGSGLSSESVSVDIHGNQIVSRTIIDRDAKTTTATTDYPDSTENEMSATTLGLLTSTHSKTGLDYSYAYDALGRMTGMTDPRTGTTVLHYNENGRVDWSEDPAGNRARFEYDQNTGRKTVEFNGLGKATRYAHNGRGQLIRTWGDVPYPVEYVYDNYGRMIEMHTFRNSANWNSQTWPAGQIPDIARWHYQEATGLLVAKEDAAGMQTRYTYEIGGYLSTRTWARLNAGPEIVTSYVNDPNTGELSDIDYSDMTPDIHVEHDRIGRQTTITDAIGTRTFVYHSDTLQLVSETVNGIVNQTFIRTYETENVRGRYAGFTLDSNYSVTYGYDMATGRSDRIAWNANGQSDNANYAYVANSNLIAGIATGGGQMITSYTYEEKRNLKTSVENAYNATLISRYGYEYDAIGRRTSVTNTGTAFAQPAFNRYSYNGRDELIGSNRYLATDINDVSIPVDPETRIYNYDPIGNRNSAIAGNETETYAPNNLNQYTDITTGGTMENLTYDEDGNLTAYNGKVYTYNGENRLISIQPAVPANDDIKVEFVYDYLGRRIVKKKFVRQSGQWQENTTKTFAYDGWNMVYETTIRGGNETAKAYVWGLDLSRSLQGAGGIGGLVACIDTTSTYSCMYDANGNMGQLIDNDTGVIAAHYEYDGFGIAIKVEGTYAEENSFRFSSKYFDEETGFYYYGYRYYLAAFGRWMTRDPIGERGGVNSYVFTTNNPVFNYDPFGLFSYNIDKNWNGVRVIDSDDEKMIKDSIEVAKERMRVLIPQIDKEINWLKLKDCNTLNANPDVKRQIQSQIPLHSAAQIAGISNIIEHTTVAGGGVSPRIVCCCEFHDIIEKLKYLRDVFDQTIKIVDSNDEGSGKKSWVKLMESDEISGNDGVTDKEKAQKSMFHEMTHVVGSTDDTNKREPSDNDIEALSHSNSYDRLSYMDVIQWPPYINLVYKGCCPKGATGECGEIWQKMGINRHFGQ